MPRSTIVFFDHSARWSGGEISLFNLVMRLDRTRFRPLVVLFEEGPLREELDAAGIAVRVIPLGAGVQGARKDALAARFSPGAVVEMLRFVRRLRQLLRAEDAQIAHCNSLKADVLGGCAARWAGVPVIWHVRDQIGGGYLPAPVAGVFRSLARRIPTQIIAVSDATLRALQLPPSQPARVIHNGVVLDHFAASHAPFSRPNDAFTVGLVGRLAPWKGQHVFLEAAAQVKQRFPRARFQIVGAPLFGEDDYAAQLLLQAEKLGLNGSVEWLGFRSDVPQIVARFDVLAHASTMGEPFGQVIVEGMAAGRPVVATRGGGVPEIVREGETGLLVPMGDADALARAIVELGADPARARALGEAGRQRAGQHFSIEATVAQVEEVYEAMLGASRGEAPPREAPPVLVQSAP